VAESRRHARVLNVVCRARGGIVDNVETRRIINALVADSGGINIAQAHEQLERLLGNQYDAERWGKLFNHVVCEPGEVPVMTVEDAFQFAALPEASLGTHTRLMEEYHNVRDAILV
jgi:hypothetical protein